MKSMWCIPPEQNADFVAHMEDVLVCEAEEAELQDVDEPEQLRKWEKIYGESGKSGKKA